MFSPMTGPSPRNRRTPTSEGVVVLVRDHLRTVLARTATPFPCRYACLIHPRCRQGERGFGVITLAGESLALTVALLESLRRMPTLLEGTDPVERMRKLIELREPFYKLADFEVAAEQDAARVVAGVLDVARRHGGW